MSAPDDEKPLSVNTGKRPVLSRPAVEVRPSPRAVPPAERRPERTELTEEQRAEALKYLREPDREPPPPPKKARKVSVQSPDPDLIRWTQKYVRQLRTPRTATEIVDTWYSGWRNHEDKPKAITKSHKAGHVDRVSKWLERHEKAGRLRMAGQKPGGKKRWPAKSYVPVEGAEWRRPRKPKDA